ncbi:unnamed protein product [Adineta ricciae]|uniref:Uncharacterized protein n=1 Tax=Adineta ricciae TaxID=249248 RepID=A0A815RNQ0_ADIRI|nr:unnamed protein product [Adineta ricciae]
MGTFDDFETISERDSGVRSSQEFLDCSTSFCHFSLQSAIRDDQARFEFTSSQLGFFPFVSSEPLQLNNSNAKKTTNAKTLTKTDKNWYCNRGILVLYNTNHTKTCLCPPSYYGKRCQWQNQRISLTLQFIYQTNASNAGSIFQLVITLIDQQKYVTSYHEQILYIPEENCDTKFNIYLLYPTKPKNRSANYSIHIDIFDKLTLVYYGSWSLSIPFQFLPVNRIATQISIPSTPMIPPKSCPLACGHHGRCVEYLNKKNSYFCQCQQGYSGAQCHIQHNCSCSSKSLCLSSSICVCPLNKFGSKCYLNHSICQQTNNPCENNGLCVPVDDRMGLHKFFCLCPDGFYGKTCQYNQNRIDIYFDPNKINMRPFIFAHFIRASENDNRQYTTVLKKVHIQQNLLTLYMTFPFHLIFIELVDHKFYLAVVRETFFESEHIQASILSDQQCYHINQIMNKTLLQYPFLRRTKYYPLLCQQNSQLKCFHDEYQMCICDRYRFSNCFAFNISSISYDCQGKNICENNAFCLQDNPTCPTRSICICQQCYYGTKCQFSTRGFVSSLDYILGYHIVPHRSIHQQSFIIKMTIVITSLMLCLGLINGLLSIMAYEIQEIKSIGCGLYLLISSWNSICLIIMLVIKCWHLFLSQISVLNNRSYLKFSCVSLDFILNILIATNDWFGGCISIEQVFVTYKGANFNQSQSKKLAKRIIFGIYVLTVLTNIHDPFYRQLIDDVDIDERRTWCIVQYSPTVDTYNTIVTFFHFLIPFAMNFFSTTYIIVLMAHSRATTQPRTTLRTNLREQFRHHKHNLIASCALLLLALPRLIISFVSRCMKSSQNPSLFLIGYLVSFVPSMMTLTVFIMSADGYKEEFYSVIRRVFIRFHRMRVGVMS